MTRFGRSPAKGTKARAMLLMAMRPQGVTAKEAREAGAGNRMSSLFSTQMQNEKGYDLRLFRCEKHRACFGSQNNANAWAWRLVGKYRWDGSYRSFINRALDKPPLRKASARPTPSEPSSDRRAA